MKSLNSIMRNWACSPLIPKVDCDWFCEMTKIAFENEFSVNMNSQTYPYYQLWWLFFEFLKVLFFLLSIVSPSPLTKCLPSVWIWLTSPGCTSDPQQGRWTCPTFWGQSRSVFRVDPSVKVECRGVPFCVVEATRQRMSGLAWSFLVFKTPQLTTKDSNFQEENFPPRGAPFGTEMRHIIRSLGRDCVVFVGANFP